MTSSRHNLCLFILLETASKVEFDSKHSDAGSKPIPYTCKCSVNDDIEMSIRNILDGKRLQEDFNVFLNIILTALELKQVEENDENFWMSLDNYQAKITKDIRWWAEMTNARIDKDQTNRQSTSDPNIKFVRCRIYRRSFHLKYKEPFNKGPLSRSIIRVPADTIPLNSTILELSNDRINGTFFSKLLSLRICQLFFNFYLSIYSIFEFHFRQ